MLSVFRLRANCVRRKASSADKHCPDSAQGPALSADNSCVPVVRGRALSARITTNNPRQCVSASRSSPRGLLILTSRQPHRPLVDVCGVRYPIVDKRSVGSGAHVVAAAKGEGPSMRGSDGDRAVESVGHPRAGSTANPLRIAGRARRQAWQGQPIARRAGTRHRGRIAVILDVLGDTLASGPGARLADRCPRRFG